jgi:hypothetical protein
LLRARSLARIKASAFGAEERGSETMGSNPTGPAFLFNGLAQHKRSSSPDDPVRISAFLLTVDIARRPAARLWLWDGHDRDVGVLNDPSGGASEGSDPSQLMKPVDPHDYH